MTKSQWFDVALLYAGLYPCQFPGSPAIYAEVHPVYQWAWKALGKAVCYEDMRCLLVQCCLERAGL